MNTILPSLLAVPTLHVGKSIDEFIQLGLQDFHVDIMDYHFTPNFGLSIHHIEEIQLAYPKSNIDVHLMTSPTRQELIEKLIHIGIKDISIHLDTLSPNTLSWINQQSINIRTALNPSDPIPKDLPSNRVLILCVNPGFSHQKFQEEQLKKIAQAKALGLDVMVDGGINHNNIHQIMPLNPDHLVIGSGLTKLSTAEKANLIQTITDLQG
jgi:ribulose-phosphate 3-epimerase